MAKTSLSGVVGEYHTRTSRNLVETTDLVFSQGDIKTIDQYYQLVENLRGYVGSPDFLIRLQEANNYFRKR